mgnify:CR=1 FL=1|jgi:hypothetical protein
MAKKHTTFTPLLLQVDNPSDVFQKHRLELSKSAVEAVSYCVNNKLTNIVFVEIETIPSLSTLQLRVDQQSFLDVLDKNLETLEKFEEYELCAEILRLRDKITKDSAKKTRIRRKNRSIDDLINVIKDL